MLDAITGNMTFIVASMAATSVFLACLVVSWPYLAPDMLGARVNQIGDEREALRIRERSKLQGGKQPLSGQSRKSSSRTSSIA